MHRTPRYIPLFLFSAILLATLAPLSAYSEITQKVVPDEISVGNKLEENEGAKRVSEEDLIKLHHFKLEKGAWSLSYKPDKLASVPLVWCDLRFTGIETNEANCTYKKFEGTYSDLLNKLEVLLIVFEDGGATLYVKDLKEDTKVVYYLSIGTYDWDERRDFMKAVYKNN